MKILTSNIDKSVNFIEEKLTGFIETRYVRRTTDYFIAYLSSQTGCNRGCKMCHLTTTNQTQFKNCDMLDFVSQADTIFKHYEKDVKAKYVHWNFMARGEPLANPTVIETGTELLLRLGQYAKEKNLPSKFNISTIMPVTYKKSLTESFPFITPTIYYSIYSVDPYFRNRWLPAAMPVGEALDQLREYQKMSKKIIRFHCAFIKDENDGTYDIHEMMNEITKRKIIGEFNIVRYNPYSKEQGEETEQLHHICKEISDVMPCKIITRVGEDVRASCGQFIPKQED